VKELIAFVEGATRHGIVGGTRECDEDGDGEGAG
jgi:hypothetical protein